MIKRVHVMSDRAKHALYPALGVFLATIISFLAHLLVLGTSAFPGGHVVDGRYLVEDHGKVIELTAGEFWFSYVHGIVLVTVAVILAILIAVFYFLGDLRDEYPVA